MKKDNRVLLGKEDVSHKEKNYLDYYEERRFYFDRARNKITREIWELFFNAIKPRENSETRKSQEVISAEELPIECRRKLEAVLNSI